MKKTAEQVLFERVKLAGATEHEAQLLVEARKTAITPMLLKVTKHAMAADLEPIAQVLERLDEKIVLNEELQEKLNKLGNTPIHEPNIAKAIENEATEGIIPILELVLSKEDFTKYQPNEIGDFVYALKQQITSLKDENGVFKRTPATDECQMPNVIQIDELTKLITKLEVARNKALESGDEKAKDELIELSKQLNEKVEEVTGLKSSDLTQWEMSLVTNMTYEAIRGFRNHSQGKRL